MAEPTTTSGADGQTNGAAAPEPRRSLHEIAKETYDELTRDAESGANDAQPASPDGTQPRDQRGRFASKEAPTGEAVPAEQGTQPREDGQQPQPAQPARGDTSSAAASSEAPAHWPQAVREMFSKQPPEVQQFLHERHTAMESDYQRKVQANAAAANFAQSVAPVFNDPRIARSLQESGVDPAGAVNQWANFHLRYLTDPVNMIGELIARARIDPAVFATSRPGQNALPPEVQNDPAIKFFADHISRNSNDVQSLMADVQRLRQAEMARQNAQNAEAERVANWKIDSFAGEKDAQGNLKHPDFWTLLDDITDLYKANPDRDLEEAYERARRANPTTFQALIAAERTAIERRLADQRASQAVKSNLRGITSPVSKPQSEDGKPKGLRAALEEAAEEIGFSS